MKLSAQRLPLMFFILSSQAAYKNNKIIGTGYYFDVLQILKAWVMRNVLQSIHPPPPPLPKKIQSFM